MPRHTKLFSLAGGVVGSLVSLLLYFGINIPRIGSIFFILAIVVNIPAVVTGYLLDGFLVSIGVLSEFPGHAYGATHTIILIFIFIFLQWALLGGLFRRFARRA